MPDLKNPIDTKDLPTKIKCDHSNKGRRFEDPFVGIGRKYKTACDRVVEIAFGLRMGRSGGSLACLRLPRSSRIVELLSRVKRGGYRERRLRLSIASGGG